MKDNALKTKSYKFAIRIVKMSRLLSEEKREYILSKQVLRSGTSIGANIEEANQGQSKIDFIHKLSISLKEAVETNYWLRILRDTGYLNEKEAESILEDCRELEKMLTASIKTAKDNR
jgi:four helix bundle protein